MQLLDSGRFLRLLFGRFTVPETCPGAQSQPSESPRGVPFKHNRRPLENTSCPPCSNFHNHSLGDSSPSQVSCCCPTKVVEVQSRNGSLFTCLLAHVPR